MKTMGDEVMAKFANLNDAGSAEITINYQ